MKPCEAGLDRRREIFLWSLIYIKISRKERTAKSTLVFRLIKRRTVANEACDAGRILVNDKVAKASLNVKPGDIIEIQFGNRNTKVEVLSINETYKKDEAKELYRYV